jgi:hypothetical protein
MLSSSPRRGLRWLLTLALGAWLFFSGLGALARADEDAPPPAMTPRDVVEVVQPGAARLGPMPADFKRLEHDWLTLELPSSVEDRVPALFHDADELRGRLTQTFAQPVLEHVIVRVARNPEQMAELAPEGAGTFSYAAGMAYPSLHVILLTLQAPQTWEAPDLSELLEHELTHVALFDAVLGHHTPRWFDEGLAIHESGEFPWPRTKTLWDAQLSHHLLNLADLDRGFPAGGYDVNIAYAESADFVRFLLRDADRARFGSFIHRLRSGTAFDRALEDAYGTDLKKLEYEWHEEIGRRFSMIPMLTGGGVLWAVMSGLLVVAWVKRRRRARAKLAEWEREEAEMDAVRARAREDAAKPEEPEDDDTMPPGSMPGIPVVEHEGRWYTVH